MNKTKTKSKLKTIVEFEVDYMPTPMAVKLSDIMSRLDLGIKAIFITNTFRWKTSTKVDQKYIKRMGLVLKKGIETNGGKVVKIKSLN